MDECPRPLPPGPADLGGVAVSVRNPIRGRRRRPEPGDRLIYHLPPGPPAAAIKAFGGDVQAAITAALTLLALSLQGPAASKRPSPSPQPDAIEQPDRTDPVANVIAQDFFQDP